MVDISGPRNCLEGQPEICTDRDRKVAQTGVVEPYNFLASKLSATLQVPKSQSEVQ